MGFSIFIVIALVAIIAFILLSRRKAELGVSNSVTAVRELDDTSIGPVESEQLSKLSAASMLDTATTLRRDDAQWEEILDYLNPTKEQLLHELIIKIRGPHMFNPREALGVIMQGCEDEIARSPTADGLAALQRAYAISIRVTGTRR